MANPNLKFKMDYHFTDKVTSQPRPPPPNQKTFKVWSEHSEDY